MASENTIMKNQVSTSKVKMASSITVAKDKVTSEQRIQEERYSKEQDEEEDNEEDEEEKDVVEVNEEEVEEEGEVKRKRRCEGRKRKKRSSTLKDTESKDAKLKIEVTQEENEDEEEDDGEREESEEEDISSVSSYSSIYSAVSFIWEDQYYEFLDLCNPNTIEGIYVKEPAEISYDLYGKNRYLNFCDALRIPPVVSFYNALHKDKVDLTYHGISKKQMKAMCAALESNAYVESLIFGGNPLSPGSCAYLATLLTKNYTITHLDLRGCKIGGEGAVSLCKGLSENQSLKELNFSKCDIGDQGMLSLAHSLRDNTTLETLILSHNKLGAEAAEALGSIFGFNNSITNVDLCYNNLYDGQGMKKFFRGLVQNSAIKIMDLRWNAMSDLEISTSAGQCLKLNSTLEDLDLSDNRFNSVSILPFKRGIASSQSLQILRLARNPLTSKDLEALLPAVKKSPKLKLLDLQELWVRKEFMKSLKKIQQIKEVEVIVGGVYSNYTVTGPDYPALILKRAQFEAQKPKKAKLRKDFGHLMFLLGDESLTADQFMATVNKFKAKVNKELYPELLKQFTIPRQNMIDVVAMRTKYLSLFPDTIPPEIKKTKKESDVQEVPVQEIEKEQGVPDKKSRVVITDEAGMMEEGTDEEFFIEGFPVDGYVEMFFEDDEAADGEDNYGGEIADEIREDQEKEEIKNDEAAE